MSANLKSTLTHGHSRRGGWSPEYYSWASMKQRCTNPARIGYHLYGGRGIRVCERWLSFENFLADMGPRPDGASLDRIDTNGHYEPANCAWRGRKAQNRNRRNNKLSPQAANEIRALRAAGIPQRSIAAQFGVSHTMVRNIERGLAWK